MLFYRQFGFQEATLGILGYRHEGYPLIHVAEIGIESKFQFARDLSLLLAKLHRERIEDRVLDPPVEIVDVDLFHALAQALALLLQALHGGIMIVTKFGEVLPQRAHQPAEHAVSHFDSVQHVGELLEQHLLTHIWFAAFLLRVAAPVIDIFLLLDVAHQEATAMTAFDHTGEQEVFLDAADTCGVAAIEDTLDALPQLGRDQGLVRSLVALAQPLEFAGVDS